MLSYDPDTMRRLRPLVAALLVALCVTPARAEQASSDEAELLAKVDVLAAEVAKLRGLAVRKPIQRGVMDKPALKKRILERIDQEYTDAEIRGEGLAMKRLGLIPAEADYLDMVVGLLTDQIAGFYDPWEKQLYLANWQSFGGDMLMAHEIAHALQDQHFDLKRFMMASKEDADATVARQALVEGDGTALMIEFTTRATGTTPWGNDAFIEQMSAGMSAQMGSLGNVPLALREGLVFPYLGGVKFVAHVRKHKPWKAVDAIYRKPPLSTEHILHPEKYDRYEAPIAVTATTPAVLSGYDVVYDNVTGEKGFELFLRQHGVDDARARVAAAGWGGDRVAVYAPPKHGAGIDGVVGVMYTVWDAEADAMEFYDALTHALPQLAGSKGRRRGASVIEHRLPSGGAVIAERRGESVVLIVGAPPARTGDLLRDAWAWKVAD